MKKIKNFWKKISAVAMATVVSLGLVFIVIPFQLTILIGKLAYLFITARQYELCPSCGQAIKKEKGKIFLCPYCDYSEINAWSQKGEIMDIT